MSKLASRLLVFFIGVPLVMAIIYISYLYHMPFQIAIGIFAVLGANEFYNMLSTKSKLFSKPIILIGTALIPYSSYLFILFGLNPELTLWIFLLEAIILMTISILQKTFDQAVIKIANSLFIIFYCGYLLTFLSRMTLFENSRYWIALFFIFVFMCDSLAWFFGILFGKNNRGIFPASPNKSVAGFLGGILGAIACGVIFKIVFKKIVTVPYWKIIILGLITSLAGIIGDLIESVIKRSLECKDSGKLMPGRGGILDSIDSAVIAAPIYYAGLYFLFGI